jgi:hypothetical protein
MHALYRQLDEIQKTESRTHQLSPEKSAAGPLVVGGWWLVVGGCWLMVGVLPRAGQSLDVHAVATIARRLLRRVLALRLLVAALVFDMRPSSTDSQHSSRRAGLVLQTRRRVKVESSVRA